MIAQLLGALDWPQAVAVSVLFTAVGVVTLVGWVTHKSQREYQLDHERIALEKLRIEAQQETTRQIELRKVEKGLITSHREG